MERKYLIPLLSITVATLVGLVGLISYFEYSQNQKEEVTQLEELVEELTKETDQPLGEMENNSKDDTNLDPQDERGMVINENEES